MVNASGAPLVTAAGVVPIDTAVIWEDPTSVVIADSATPITATPGPIVNPINDLAPAGTGLAQVQAATAGTPVAGDWFELAADTVVPAGEDVPSASYLAGEWFLFDGTNWHAIRSSSGVIAPPTRSGRYGAITGTGNTFETLFSLGPQGGGLNALGEWIEVATNGTLPTAGDTGGIGGQTVSVGDAVVLMSTNPTIYHIEPSGVASVYRSASTWLAGCWRYTHAGRSKHCCSSARHGSATGDPAGSSSTNRWVLPPTPPPEGNYIEPPQAPTTQPDASVPAQPQIDPTDFQLPSVVVGNLGPVVTLQGGGWLYLNREVWRKDTRATPDQQTDQKRGDQQITTEAGHEEAKIWDEVGGQWITWYSRDAIDAAIASMSLFEGTVNEVGGGAIGALDLDALPDIDAMSQANDLVTSAITGRGLVHRTMLCRHWRSG